MLNSLLYSYEVTYHGEIRLVKWVLLYGVNKILAVNRNDCRFMVNVPIVEIRGKY